MGYIDVYDTCSQQSNAQHGKDAAYYKRGEEETIVWRYSYYPLVLLIFNIMMIIIIHCFFVLF